MKNEWSYASALLIRLHGVDKETFIFKIVLYPSAGLVSCVQCFESGCSSVQGVMTIMRTAPPCPGARREASVTMLTPQYHSTLSGQ